MLNIIKERLFPNESVRHAFVQSEISKLPKGQKILDAGCGTGRYKESCSHLEYFAQDFGQYVPDGEGLQCEKWEYIKLDYIGNIWEINEKDSFFDAILCAEVIEHIPYPNETIHEFSRLIKRGGVLILTAPYASLPHMRPYFFYSGFSKEWYEHILNKYGFEIMKIERNGNYFKFLLQENVRCLKILRNPFLRIIFLFALIPVAFLQFVASKFSKNDYLVFGYHVLAKKVLD
jgi:ubiquinone/menaquinone biosynthesis C-methylase UbiE